MEGNAYVGCQEHFFPNLMGGDDPDNAYIIAYAHWKYVYTTTKQKQYYTYF